MLAQQGNSSIPLESLNLSFSMQGMNIVIDWFRMLAQNQIPNENWHSHSGIELHFLIEGAHEIQVGDQSFSLSAGELLLIPRSMLHRLSNPSCRDYLRYVMNVDISADECNGGERFLYEALMQSSPVKVQITEEMRHLLEACQAETKDAYAGYISMIELMVVQLLFTLARELTDYPRSTDTNDTKRTYSSQIAEKLIGYIEHNVYRKISVADIANAMHISAKNLQRIAQKEYKCTVKALIVYSRLKIAKGYLKNTQMTISEISESMGFSTEQSFCRFFRCAEGQTPSQYRKGFLGER